jgi:Tol biopolymer transport system component
VHFSRNRLGISYSPDDLPSNSYVGTGHEWSPTGNRVAYFKDGYLVVADLDQGTTEQTLLPHPHFVDQMPYAPIRWSPNGRHLSVEFGYTVPAVIDLFSIENGTPSLLAELPFEIDS